MAKINKSREAGLFLKIFFMLLTMYVVSPFYFFSYNEAVNILSVSLLYDGLIVNHHLLLTVHDSRRRRKVLATTAIFGFAFQFKAKVFSVRLIRLLCTLHDVTLQG